MASTVQLLTDGFTRVRDTVHHVIDGVDEDMLMTRIDADANPMGWLVWHLTRVQDDHVADVAGTDQVWTAKGWADRFALPYDTSAVGYGQTSDEVGQFRGVTAEQLAGYHDAAHATTLRFISGLSDPDLDRIIDRNWDPPVTLGVRLVSVLADDLQHVGQAAFVRGVLERRGR